MIRWMIALPLAATLASAQTPTAPASPPSAATPAAAPAAPGDSVSLRIESVDLRTAVQLVQPYLDRPVIFSGSAGPSVTLDTPHPVPRAAVPRLLRGLLESQNYELINDTATGTYRARPRDAARGPGPAPPVSAAPPRAAAGTPELFVIALEHARAADVAATVNTLFGRGGASGVPGGPPPRTLGDELRDNRVAAVDAPVPRAPVPVSARAATLSGETTIVPDPHANRLLVRADRADFELIRDAVAQVDVRPMQVLIEVLIVEARRDRSFSLAIDASVDQQHVDHTQHTTIGGTYAPASPGLGDLTLKVMGAGGIDLDATISAAAGRGDVKVLSRPVVLAANDEQAEVVVGEQRPFVQVSRALPTEDAVRDQVVQYKDVGTKLTVRPTISVDGTVQLEVAQEVSNATTETAFDAPVIATRSIRTDLLVRDSQTVILGGLTDREHDVRSSGVPILSSIPFIGGLFGSHSRSSTETELFIFLTPHVIRSDADAERITNPLRARAGRVAP